jgi:NAD-dependent deacetylase
MDKNSLTKLIQEAVQLIIGAKFAVALTGAGSSTPSGIPDFRSRGSGLWNQYSPMEVASLTAFHKNPEQFFNWLRPIANQMMNANPNPAHIALAQIEKKKHLKTIITQNIDGLHQKAGSKNVLEVHGTMNYLTCIGCYKQVDATGFKTTYLHDGKIPICEICGNILKPNVILFEEQLPSDTWIKARNAAQSCDLMMILGTSLVVSPVSQLPQHAKRNGARIIIVNKSRTYMDEFADIVIQDDVESILPKITNFLLYE